MGEYYRWVNVDRKEYISPADFGYGSKRYESCGYTNEVLGALRNLLFNEWKGCRVFWMGDESLLPENNDSDLFSIMKAQCDALGSRGICLTRYAKRIGMCQVYLRRQKKK